MVAAMTRRPIRLLADAAPKRLLPTAANATEATDRPHPIPAQVRAKSRLIFTRGPEQAATSKRTRVAPPVPAANPVASAPFTDVDPIRLIHVGRKHPSDGLRNRHPVRRLIDRLNCNGWPLKYLLVPFPLWWVLGLSSLIFPIAAIPMARQLHIWYRRDGRIAVPPAFALWALFVAWQILDLSVFGLSPPGTAAGSLSGRVLTLGFTFVEYVGVTIALLYVGNLPRDPARGGVSSFAIGRWMGWMFLTVLGGGYLGVVDRHLQFTSAVEYVLPSSISGNGFVHALVHPVAAQIQTVISADNGRPAAPFGYTNIWGNTLGILIIWFVVTWVVPARGMRRVLFGGLAAASVIPIVFSLNRGLWIGLAVTVMWLLFRQLLRGHIGPLLAAFGALAVLGAVAALTPLASVVTSRLENGTSNSIRSFVAHLSVVAIEHSPIVGYGGNRHAIGSASSIAVGPTKSCPTCGSVPTGSTGDLWQLMFNDGLVGTLLYFGFFLAVLCVFWRTRSTIGEASLVTIALVFVFMLFYSGLPVAPTLTMIAIGILWRESKPETTESIPVSQMPVSPDAGLVR